MKNYHHVRFYDEDLSVQPVETMGREGWTVIPGIMDKIYGHNYLLMEREVERDVIDLTPQLTQDVVVDAILEWLHPGTWVRDDNGEEFTRRHAEQMSNIIVVRLREVEKTI